MIARYNRTSLLFGVPGIVLQIGGGLAGGLSGADASPKSPLGLVMLIVGTVLLFFGLGYYAKAKGRNPAWCLMALLSWVGLIVLALLRDKAPAEVQ